jgi:phosphatidylserine decarboxylase
MHVTSGGAVPYRVGAWLPSDQAFLDAWLAAIIHRTHAEQKALHPVIADFRDLIEGDSQIFMLFHLMFEQVPKKSPYHKDPTGKPQVRDYGHMLQILNTVLTQAP